MKLLRSIFPAPIEFSDSGGHRLSLRSIVFFIVALLFLVCDWSSFVLPQGRQTIAFGSESSVTLEVSQNVLAVGERLTMKLRLSGDLASDFQRPQLPDAFEIVGESSSSSFQLAGGQVTKERTISYEIAALRTGRFTIGPFEVGAGSSRVSSNAASIEVRPPPQNGERVLAQNGDTDLPFSIQAALSAQEAYVGQQLLITIDLSHKESERQVQYRELRFPPIEGMKIDDLGEPQSKVELINGVRIRSVVVRKKITPLKAGQFSIAGIMAVAEVLTPSRSPQGRNFFGSMTSPFERQLRSASAQVLNLNVKEVPIGERPNDFSGLVGETSWDVSYGGMGKNALQVGESVPITVRITSTGELAGVVLKVPASSSYIKIYEDSAQLDASSNLNLNSTKVFHLAAVFLKPGSLAPDPLEFVYFSPQEGEYRRLAFSFPKVTVSGRAASGTGIEPIEQLSKIEMADQSDQGFNPIKYRQSAFAVSAVTRELWFVGIGIPGILFFVLCVWMLADRVLVHLPWFRRRLRQRQALQRALVRLKQIEESNKAQFGNLPCSGSLSTTLAKSVLEVVRDYLEDRTLLKFGHHTISEWKSIFGKSVSSGTASESDFWLILSDLEGLLYSGGQNFLMKERVLFDSLRAGLSRLDSRVADDKQSKGDRP